MNSERSRARVGPEPVRTG